MNSKYWQLHNSAVAADKFLNEKFEELLSAHVKKVSIWLIWLFVYMASSDPVDFFLL